MDSENFRASISCINEERKQDRYIDWHKMNLFVLDYLSNNPQFKNEKLSHIRTYVYTGEYTEHLIKRIEDALKKGPENDTLKRILDSAKRNREGQIDFYKKAGSFYFFEIRKKPLQFTPSKGIFQKGVDVQLAVDLVSFAHQNIYDIAVIFSGDIDLLESLRTVKNLGKQVIIFSHYKNIAVEMKREADMHINFQNMTDKQLDGISHIFQKKQDH
ncbi:NYN domain-containing protein [Candidatus Woesearchaeota archaeon]|nr:NYN domain-containing protein [Candidatus Woesearchaeota archaeon]